MVSRAPQLHVCLLGSPEVRLGESPLAFPTRKTLALFVYLAIEAAPQRREHLAALLWPEGSPERSYASLRNTLGRLQTALRRAGGQTETPYLLVTHNSLALNPGAGIDIDLRAVERAYTLARAERSSRSAPEGSASLPLLQSVAALQRGDFLAGFSLSDAPEFDDWETSQREIWNRRLGLILDRLSEIQYASGEFASATETASRWIALDVLNEVAYRRKMRAHFAAGERGQALETYDACRAILAAELGVTPEPDTEALAARIRSQYPLRRSSAPPRRPDTPVAFLENLFAGRSAERQALVAGYKRAAAGQPQVAILRGEAGIGKTRLAREFLAWAGAQGAELLQGGAFESGSHLPFQPLAEALRSRLENEESSRELLDDAWLASLARLLPELTERDAGPAPVSRKPGASDPRPEAEISRMQLFESFVQWTLALAKQTGLVLFVDDLQWADSATLDLLQFVIRRWRESRAPALLLVSLRPEALLPLAQPRQTDGPQGLIQWLAQAGRELTPFYVDLEPLSENDTVQMVLSILAPPAADFAQWVYAETRGQPFYLMESLKDLLERGALRPTRRGRERGTGSSGGTGNSGGGTGSSGGGTGSSGGTSSSEWTFAVVAEHDLGKAVRVPSTVRAVIRSRLNRLSPNAFSLLAAASVLEQRITYARLCAVSNLPEDVALPALDELISGHLLLEVAQPGAASAYAFSNDMIRDVVYTEAGDARRRLFHRRSLEVLEAAKDSAAVLAYHALAAGLAQTAFHHSLAAGREALRLSALNEAIVHFEQARKLAGEAPVRKALAETDLRELYSQLQRAYELKGLPDQALSVAAEWARMAQEAGH